MSLYNGYVRCVDNTAYTNCYTAGKVYKICDGTLITDYGYKIMRHLRSFDELQGCSASKWEELELVKCDKYEVGDDVVVQSIPNCTCIDCEAMCKFINQVCKITKVYHLEHWCSYGLNHEILVFDSTSFAGKLVPKVGIVKSKLSKNKEWTKNEVKKARHIVTEYIKMLARSRTTLVFYTSTKSIKCCLIKIQTNSSEIDVVRENTAFCKDNDIFNVDIGMCVAACKVLNKPIPDFILNK